MSLDSYPAQPAASAVPLIGRRTEIADWWTLLERERVVTLTGSGGVGKTRLALAVGAELVASFPGGVWFVELAAARATGSVGRATLKAGPAGDTGRAPAELAAVELGDGGRSFVILDNCEHLIAECAEFVVTVLAESSTCRCWRPAASSSASPARWRGGCRRCRRHPERMLPVEALSQYDAVNLFVDRARRARPSFSVNESTRRRSPRCATGWTGSRSPSSSPPRAVGTSAPNTSPTNWTTASGC